MQVLNNTARKQPLSPQIIASGKGCGAEVVGVDLAALDPVTIATLQQAIREHLVVVVRGQPISDPQLIALGKSFGELEPPGMSPIGKPFIDEFPDILVISNIMEQGMPMGNLGAGEAIWHTDMSYRPRPCTIAILHALEVPPAGGNTYFANQYMAYDTLSEELKKNLDGLEVIHDETYNSGGQMRKGFKEVTDPRQAPGARHKIFRTHPHTGRKALFLGRRRNAYIIGLPLDESERLLDELWAHASRPEFMWHNEWKVGDTLIWDNRALIHRRDSFDNNQRRMMHRVQIRGETTS
jgi:taurine dioxygenase